MGSRRRAERKSILLSTLGLNSWEWGGGKEGRG